MSVQVESPIVPMLKKLDKWKIFEAAEYHVHHPAVRAFHDSDAKVKVAVAPRRTTKSFSSAHDVLPLVMCENTRVWVVGPSYSLAEKEFRYIYEAVALKMRKNMGLPKPKRAQLSPRSGQLYLEWGWGAVVEGRSADRPDSLLGEAVDAVIYSEAAELPRLIRERFVSPTLNTRRGREIVPTTPQSKAEWVHELWEAGFDDEYPDIQSFQWDRTANPLYDEGEFQRAKKFYGEDSPVFREQYLGEWVYYGGLVFNTFSPATHVIEPFDIPRDWRVYRAIDFGHRDPFVCLFIAVGPQQELYVFQEYYNKEGLSMREHAINIKARSKGYRLGMTVGDPAAKQSIEDLNSEGVGCESANNDRVAGRMRVMEYLAKGADGTPPWPEQQTGIRSRLEYPRMYIFNNCKELLRELKYYRWKEGRAVEDDKEKTEGDDHAVDALRYGIFTRPSPYRAKKRFMPGSFDQVFNKIKNTNMRSPFYR